MKAVWPDAVVEESNLAQYMHILRKTLGTMPDAVYQAMYDEHMKEHVAVAAK